MCPTLRPLKSKQTCSSDNGSEREHNANKAASCICQKNKKYVILWTSPMAIYNKELENLNFFLTLQCLSIVGPKPQQRRGVWCKKGHQAIQNFVVCNYIDPSLGCMSPTSFAYRVEEDK